MCLNRGKDWNILVKNLGYVGPRGGAGKDKGGTCPSPQGSLPQWDSWASEEWELSAPESSPLWWDFWADLLETKWCSQMPVGLAVLESPGAWLLQIPRARDPAAEGLRRGPGRWDFQQLLRQRCQASECGDHCSRVEGSSKVLGTQLCEHPDLGSSPSSVLVFGTVQVMLL